MTNIPITPIVTQSFDKAWIQSIMITGSPTSKTRAVISLKPYDGTITLDLTKTLIIDDVFALAAEDAEFNATMTALIEEVARQVALKKLI
jgi:hypothetical protein